MLAPEYLGSCHLYKDLNGVLSTKLWPSPALSVAGIWDVNQQKESLS